MKIADCSNEVYLFVYAKIILFSKSVKETKWSERNTNSIIVDYSSTQKHYNCTSILFSARFAFFFTVW